MSISRWLGYKQIKANLLKMCSGSAFHCSSKRIQWRQPAISLNKSIAMKHFDFLRIIFIYLIGVSLFQMCFLDLSKTVALSSSNSSTF